MTHDYQVLLSVRKEWVSTCMWPMKYISLMWHCYYTTGNPSIHALNSNSTSFDSSHLYIKPLISQSRIFILLTYLMTVGLLIRSNNEIIGSKTKKGNFFVSWLIATVQLGVVLGHELSRRLCDMLAWARTKRCQCFAHNSFGGLHINKLNEFEPSIV